METTKGYAPGTERAQKALPFFEAAAPFVNLNGTSREELQRQKEEAISAIREAYEALTRAAPHARDWQTASQDAFRQASREHVFRLECLRLLCAALEAEHEIILG